MSAFVKVLLAILDNPWVNRTGNAVFLFGALGTVIGFVLGLGLLTIAFLAMMAVGVVLMASQYLPRGVKVGADPLQANVFVGTGAVYPGTETEPQKPVDLRLAGIPFFNETEKTASNVTAWIEVFDPDTGTLLDAGSGRWRELGDAKGPEIHAHISGGVVLGVELAGNSQRHVLDVLAQERPQTRLQPGWQIIRNPLSFSTSAVRLQAGAYRLKITLRSPDFRKPLYFNYDLEVQPDGPLESDETAPRLRSRSD
jgi:hypothetical protein